MKNRELETFLSKKMKFKRTEGAKHVHFQYRPDDGRQLLPNLLNLSRGQGETTNRVFGNTAYDLGLISDELKTATRCGLSRECILLCLIIRLTNAFFHQKVQPDPQTYDQGLQRAFTLSIEQVLEDVRKSGQVPWKKDEIVVLSRARKYLQPVSESRFDVMKECAASITCLIERER
jgi:hypothetical protein